MELIAEQVTGDYSVKNRRLTALLSKERVFLHSSKNSDL